GVAVFAIECPVSPVETGIVLHEIEQALKPLSLRARSCALNIRCVVAGTKLPDQHWCGVIRAYVSPEFVPYCGQTRKTCTAVEPALLKEVRTIVVSGVHETVGNVQCDRMA